MAEQIIMAQVDAVKVPDTLAGYLKKIKNPTYVKARIYDKAVRTTLISRSS